MLKAALRPGYATLLLLHFVVAHSKEAGPLSVLRPMQYLPLIIHEAHLLLCAYCVPR
jgi:hypothetical protein